MLEGYKPEGYDQIKDLFKDTRSDTTHLGRHGRLGGGGLLQHGGR